MTWINTRWLPTYSENCSCEVMAYFAGLRENGTALVVLENALNSHEIAERREPRSSRTTSRATGAIGRKEANQSQVLRGSLGEDHGRNEVHKSIASQGCSSFMRTCVEKDAIASEGNTSSPQSALDLEPAPPNNENEGDASGANTCFVCMSKGASFVLSACGHHGVCNACRRLLVHMRLVGGKLVADTKKARQHLKSKELERTKVLCPLCRIEGRVVAFERYKGKVYKAGEATN